MNTATTFTISSSTSSTSSTFTIPIPDPTGLAALSGLTVGASVEMGFGVTYTAGSTIAGEKVWAAKWQKVGAKYVTVKKWKEQEGEGGIGTRIKLLDVVSDGRVRGDGDTDVADVELMSGDQEEENERIDDEYWEEFGEELEDLVPNWPQFEELLVEPGT